MVRTYDPTGYRINSRSAEQIAAGQAAQHQQALAENQAAGSIQTRQAAPVGLTPEQQAAQNNATLYTPSAAEQQNGGVIEASRNARLDGGTYAATGEARPAATPEQRAQNQQNLQGIMNPGYGVSSEQKRLGDRLAKLQNGGDLPLNVEDPVVRSQIQANNAQEAASIQQQLGQMQDKEKKKGNESAAADAAATNLNPQQAGASAFFQNLPPEAAALAPYFENILSEISAGQDANAEATNAMLNGGTIDVNGQQVNVKGINSVYDEMDKKIADMEAGYNSIQEGIQGMLDKVKEQQEKTISEQEDAAKDRLAWQETQMLRQAAKQKQDAVDSRIARLALTGGFGSDGGLREIEETRMEYENRMDDIKTEFGVQKTELAAKFTGLYLEASNNHLTASIQNIKDTAAALERIAGQSLSNKQARNTAEQNVLGKFLETQTAGRKEYAASLKDYAVQMQTMINQDRDDKRSQETLGWTQLKQAREIYGSAVPQAMLDSISKKLPGVDLQQVLNTPTLDELKKKASGGGRGGISFSASQLLPGGQPISLDQFIAQKSQDYQATAGGGVRSVEITKEQKKAWEKEYNAMQASNQALNPVQIQRDLAGKASYFPNVTSYEEAKSAVDDMLKNGEYDAARKFVDARGKPLTDNGAKTYKSLGTIRSALDEMDVLLDRIQDRVGPFPTQGPLWTWMNQNLETDPDYQRLLVLRGTTVGPYARGVGQETGVLTDPDVARVAAGVIDPNVSYAAMRAGLEQSKKLTEAAIQVNLSIDRANGRAVNEIEDYMNGQAAPMQSTLTPEQKAFLYK